MITIRPYQPGDREGVRRVCCHLTPEQDFDPQARASSLTIFCDYYVDCEPHNCFVAVDEVGLIVGYVYCAENYTQYRRRFMQEYAPKLKGESLHRRLDCFTAAHMPIFYRRKYPAHLHIDVLEPWQRLGLGSQLVDALAAHLRAKGVPGVMLVVGRTNEKGRNFYNKYGFRQLRSIPYFVVMGLKL